MTLKVIKRAGIFSKAKACHWCHGYRWSGWWLKIKGAVRFRPCCSRCLTPHMGSVVNKTGAVLEQRKD